MRSMTGYGRAETDHAGTKFSVELNSVNRKQSDVVINLPRDLAELEPRIRQTINENISRGRTNATVTLHSGANGARNLALNTELARSYHEAMRALQKELNAPGEITISTILQAPGVMRLPEQTVDVEEAWPAIDRALRAALADLIKMREREGKHLAKDLIHRLKAIRSKLKILSKQFSLLGHDVIPSRADGEGPHRRAKRLQITAERLRAVDSRRIKAALHFKCGVLLSAQHSRHVTPLPLRAVRHSVASC